MVITRSSDDVNDKERLDQALKEYFPDENFPFFRYMPEELEE